MNIKVIKNENDYNEAMSRLSDLMNINPELNSTEDNELELLSIIIEKYERSIIPVVTPDPIEAILLRMDQLRLSRKDLEKYIGSASRVSEVLSRKKPLSLNMIRRLNVGLEIPADILIAGEVLEDSTAFEYSKFPIREMEKRGLFAHLNHTLSELKEYAEEYISRLLHNFLPKDTGPALLRSPMHQDGSKQADFYALVAWRMCVIKKARTISNVGKFQKSDFSPAWMRDLVKLSAFDNGPLLAQEYLKRYGIVLVIEPHFPKTYLDGAAMMDNGMPIVALTLRHDRIDHFWFVLMHELAHVWKHLDTNNTFIIDDDRVPKDNLIEGEANEIAKETLIPSEAWDESDVKKTHQPIDAMTLAHKLGINPAIVAGRLRNETNDYSLMVKAIGYNQVKKLFIGEMTAS
jgi:HTH-type transcriptional regulator/antitoxin HigA